MKSVGAVACLVVLGVLAPGSVARAACPIGTQIGRGCNELTYAGCCDGNKVNW